MLKLQNLQKIQNFAEKLISILESGRITPAKREELNQWSAEVDKIELKMAQLQAVEVAQLLNKEISRCGSLEQKETRLKTQKEHKLAAGKTLEFLFFKKLK